MRWSRASPGIAVGVSTADCGPILFADAGARVVGAAHAGWRGAFTGVIEATIAAMERCGAERDNIVAAAGPMIRQPNYEVGPGVRRALQGGQTRRTNASSRPARRPATPCSISPATSRRACRRRHQAHRGHRPLHLCRRRNLLQLPPLGAPQRSRLRPAYQRDRAVGLVRASRPQPRLELRIQPWPADHQLAIRAAAVGALYAYCGRSQCDRGRLLWPQRSRLAGCVTTVNTDRIADRRRRRDHHF